MALENEVFTHDRISREEFADLLADDDVAVLVVETAGVLAGAAVVKFHGPWARHYSLAVAPQYTGRGIGFVLLMAAENRARARGYRTAYLEVRTDNARAIEFYGRASYMPLGVEPGFYEDGAAALQMAKWLQ